MVRTQIQLTDEQWKALRKMAAERNLSLAELVRQGVSILLRSYGLVTREERWERACSAVGRFRSGRKDLSQKHDEHLAEALDS
jgi:N-glycosylase/DNA lyase